MQRPSYITLLSSTYLRGVLVILIIFVIYEIGKRVFEGLRPLINSLLGHTELTASSGIVVFLVLPLLTGLLAGLVFRKHQRSRGIRAFRRMENQLTTELGPGKSMGYRVALIPWPSEETRTPGVITSTFREPDSDRELASVFLPNTPDPSNGSIKIVAVEDLEILSWNLKDLTTFHLTYGSANPE